jgi:sporulation protein YtfJ
MVQAVVSKRLVSSLKHKEYVRVKVGKVEDKLVASPLARGAGAAMSLVRADGFCVIEQNSEGVEAGETVNVELYRDLEELDSTVVAIGSHDLILDVIADLMPTEFPGNFLSSTHLGSMGGLMALKRGEAHIAPTHLLNEEDGVYNVAYLKKMFTQPMALIKGVNRIQGIIVEKGNPLGIRDVKDLVNVSTIIGEPISVDGGVTIIPVSKVTYGFASGGSDFPSKSNQDIFGGGGGAGVTITPVAFLVIDAYGNVDIKHITAFDNAAERIVGLVPEMFDKVSNAVNKAKMDKVFNAAVAGVEAEKTEESVAE